MNNIKTGVGIFVVVCSSHTLAQSQVDCKAGSSLTDCVADYLNKNDSSTLPSISKPLLDGLQKLVTGSAVGNAVTTKQDFLADVVVNLPDISDGVALKGMEDKTGDKDFDLDWNLPWCFQDGADRCVKISAAIARKPEVSASLLQSLPEASRANAKDTLDKELKSTDDYTLGISYSFNGELLGVKFGRDPRQYLNQFQALQQLYTWNALRAKGNSDTRIFFNSKLAPALGSTEKKLMETRYDKLTEQQKQEFDRLAAEYKNSIAAAAKATAYDNVVKAIDNQPQLIVATEYKRRDELVGANEKSLSVKFEMPVAWSLNSIFKEMAAPCLDGSAVGNMNTESLDSCIKNIDGIIRDATATHSWRTAFEYQYRDIDSFSVVRPAQLLNYTGKAAHVQSLSASIGRKFDASESLGASEFTFQLSYENANNDPTRNDRTKATATWALQVGKFTVPFTLVYANRPELDLTDVNQKLTATIGIKYDLDKLFGN